MFVLEGEESVFAEALPRTLVDDWLTRGEEREGKEDRDGRLLFFVALVAFPDEAATAAAANCEAKPGKLAVVPLAPVAA